MGSGVRPESRLLRYVPSASAGASGSCIALASPLGVTGLHRTQRSGLALAEAGIGANGELPQCWRPSVEQSGNEQARLRRGWIPRQHGVGLRPGLRSAVAPTTAPAALSSAAALVACSGAQTGRVHTAHPVLLPGQRHGRAIDREVDVVDDRALLYSGLLSAGRTSDLLEHLLDHKLDAWSPSRIGEDADVFEAHQGPDDLARVSNDEGAAGKLAHTTTLEHLRHFRGDLRQGTTPLRSEEPPKSVLFWVNPGISYSVDLRRVFG